jgi:hypothetical protein
VSRIVFQLSNARESDGSPSVSIALVPKDVDSEEVLFSCTAAEDVFMATAKQEIGADAIKLAGARLFSAVTEHPAIGDQLKAALLNQEESPVYVWFATKDGVELLPWEAMCSPKGEFLGLDERWALGRMATAKAGSGMFHTLEPPVRIAAVLSCLTITAAGELAALRESLAVMAPGQVELLVVASEEEVVTTLQGEIAAGTATGIRVEVIPSDLGELQTMVREFRPHILHFFCHGSVAGGPHIQLAVKSDWEAANPTGGLTAEAGQFKAFKRDGDELWLIVLNCCEGAAPSPTADAQSLALGLIREGHAPVVVAMREPVVNQVAESLTLGLYGKLLTEIGERLKTPGSPPAPLDWARMMVAARDKLARNHKDMLLSQAAASTKEWTLPVVYVRPDEFHLQVAAPPAGQFSAIPGGTDDRNREARLEIEALQSLLRSLPPGQALELRADAVARMTELAAQLGIQLPPDALDRTGT